MRFVEKYCDTIRETSFDKFIEFVGLHISKKRTYQEFNIDVETRVAELTSQKDVDFDTPDVFVILGSNSYDLIINLFSLLILGKRVLLAQTTLRLRRIWNFRRLQRTPPKTVPSARA